MGQVAPGGAGGARGGQEEPGEARGEQEEPRKEPGGARGGQDEPGWLTN